jgi:beta-lactamase regulating signal transducer with metallopeptidase domain
MLAWMLYATMASMLIGAAALALEGAMHGMRRPGRFVWTGAMVLSAGWPVLMLVLSRAETPDVPVSAIRSSLSDGVFTVSNTVALASQRALNVSIETIVLTIWGVLSALLVARVIHAFHTNALRSRGWRFATVDGIRVRTSKDLGPAVVGIADMEVVLPEWVLSFDRNLLDLVLAHEQEHRDARDPMLLFGAAVLVCLMPWNIALIWQARRLRSAMEVDCDARVLRRYPDTERYGLLLLAIAQRRSAVSPLLVATMSEPAANLSRRFAAMKDNQISPLRLATLCVFGVTAIVAAGAIDSPTLSAEELPSTAAYTERFRATPNDTTELTRYIVRGTNGAPDLQLIFRAQKFDERRLLELSELLMSDYNRTLSRTGSNDEAVGAILGVIGRIERLLGVTVQVWIGDTRLSTPEREVSEKVRSSGTSDRRAGEARTTSEERRVVGVGTRPASVVEVPKRVSDSVVAFDFQVELQARLKPGTMNMIYPEVLKNAGIAGEVLAQFVVNYDGKADMGTFKVLKSTHELFTASVREALEQAVFTPASVGGRQVRQLMQLPFSFSIK